MTSRIDDTHGTGPPRGDITGLLQSARAGDDAASERLIELAYDQLRALARAVRAGRERETLNTTALLHEAYLKLAPGGFGSVSDSLHFRRLMARAMRQVLVDAARRRSRVKRGGDAAPVTLDTALHSVESMEPATLMDLDRALEELRAVDERRADVVECRFFGGLDIRETADALGTSTATVKRDWRGAAAPSWTEETKTLASCRGPMNAWASCTRSAVTPCGPGSTTPGSSSCGKTQTRSCSRGWPTLASGSRCSTRTDHGRRLPGYWRSLPT